MQKRNRFIGNGRLDAIRSELVTFADHTCIKIRANRGKTVAGEDPSSPVYKITCAVDANGSDTANHLLVTIKLYKRDYDDAGTGAGAAAAADTYEFSYNGLGSGGSNQMIAATTIGALVKAINDNVPQVSAAITDAPYALATNVATWVDQAEFILTEEWKDAVTNDVSASFDVYKRIGLPELHHRDPIKLFDIAGTETGTVTLSIYTDDPEDGASDPIFSKVMTATQTSYLNYDELTAPVVKGPLIFSFVSANLSALNQVITYKQALNI